MGKMEMPKYRCHKEVWALKIKEIRPSRPEVVHPGGSYELTPEDSRFSDIKVPTAFVHKHSPEVGGYYVVYADGYASYSPAKAFEEGYTLIEK